MKEAFKDISDVIITDEFFGWSLFLIPLEEVLIIKETPYIIILDKNCDSWKPFEVGYTNSWISDAPFVFTDRNYCLLIGSNSSFRPVKIENILESNKLSKELRKILLFNLDRFIW